MSYQRESKTTGISGALSPRSVETTVDESPEGPVTGTPAHRVPTGRAMRSTSPEMIHGCHENICGSQPPSPIALSANTISNQLYQRLSLDFIEAEVSSQGSQGPNRTPRHSFEKPRTISKLRFFKSLNWWWWWEIGSLTIGVISTITLIAVLAAYQGQTLLNWPLPVQPNAVISILTTAIKTTILLSISACFGQLKWYHFSTPHQLYDLEAFDQASRGPWGSFLILLKSRRWTFLTAGLAFATLTSLIVEPIAQQILDFPLRETVLREVRAEIAISYDFKYRMPGDLFSQVLERDVVGFRSAALNAITGNMSPFSYNCPAPAEKCSYPAFTTLGICSLFRDTTDASTQNCTRNHTTGVHSCIISWSTIWGDLGETSIQMRHNYTDDYDNTVTVGDDEDQRPWIDIFKFGTFKAGLVSNYGPYVYHRGVRLPQNYSETSKAEPKFEGFESLWYWCAQTYAASEGTAEGIFPDLVNTTVLTPTPPNCWSPTGPEEPEFCAYSDNSTNNTYRLDDINLRLLVETTSNALASSCSLLDLKDTSSSQSSDFSGLCFFLYKTPNLEAVFRAVATQISNLIRVEGGWNMNTTTIRGEAIGTVPYIDVRWEWVSVPVLETILAVILLAMTILVAKRSRQPLLKSSVNSLIFHGLEGWTAAETAQRLRNGEGPNTLESLSKELEVVFQENEHDGIRFVRA
ncbi:hypothetical protein O1611_g219 [Lasiodiplodia mahajangana]|uniref:Uncharacterized protein n=1 Tax=Lasiodiplodia mahajangana TaxID=1108764 RepID=A0ACC2K0V6_9PEZI|nr:hypothetical protein O1611_g219 [Lasiodiplodia mahajangana]